MGNRIQTTVVTLLMSQLGTNFFDLYERNDFWNPIDSKMCEKIEVRWKIKCYDRINASVIHWIEEQDLKSGVKLDFK